MKILVIGAGAAGLMASAAAAQAGNEVCLLEKNEKAGKKIYITGKGRCNVTNACDFEIFLRNICSGTKFLYSSLRAFGPAEMMNYLEENGCRLKTERGNRVFPVSDHASDVTRALLYAASAKNVSFRYQTEVKSIKKTADVFLVYAEENGKRVCFEADRVIVCTGGLSYPGTGSTGDGYRFAESFGIKVTSLYPSLVSMKTEEDTSSLSGISLKNIRLTLRRCSDLKKITEEEGELLFTHSGISGPLVLSASAVISPMLGNGEKFLACIDLKPALDEKTLDSRILRDLAEARNSDMGNALSGLLISGIRQKVLRESGISPSMKAHDLTRKERLKLVSMVKALPFTVYGTGGFEEAVVTKGGIELAEINPSTMEAKRIPGLYFAGEVLDVDGLTGGFNLQLAWTTGTAAGKAAGRTSGS